MMPTQRAAAVRNLVATASRLDVELPPELQAAADHLAALEADRPVGTDPTSVAQRLVNHLGDPDAMRKATTKAAGDLAAADAHRRIHTPLVELCAVKAYGLVHRQRATLGTLFGDAVADTWPR